jgi:hypothetical protein
LANNIYFWKKGNVAIDSGAVGPVACQLSSSSSVSSSFSGSGSVQLSITEANGAPKSFSIAEQQVVIAESVVFGNQAYDFISNPGNKHLVN